MPCDEDLERDVLSRALRDLAFARQAAPVLKELDFTSKPRRWVWIRLTRTIREHRAVPSAAQWRSYIDKDFSKDDVKDVARATLVTLLKHTPSTGTASASLDLIRSFVQAASIRSGIEGALSAMESEDFSGASTTLHEALKRARASVGISEVEPASDGALERLKRYSSGRVVGFRFELPFVTANDLIGGGFPVGRLGGIAAWTNVGKSALSTGIAWQAAAGGPDAVVGIVTTEEPAEERLARIDARMCGIDRMDLMSGRLDAAQQAQFEFRADLHSSVMKRLHVAEIPPRSTLGEVHAFAHRLRSESRNAPILLVIDSPDHLLPMGRAENHRLQQSLVWFEMLAMCHERDLAPLSIWATTQVPKKNSQKTWELSDVAETVDKARTADVFFGLIEGDQHDGKRTRDLKFLLRKSRLGLAKRYCITVEGNLGTCDFKETGSHSEECGDADEDGA